MIGLGSYAFFWQHSDRVERPLSLIDEFEATRELDVDLFQICDYAPLEGMTDRELKDAAGAARDLGLQIELGTKGIEPEHLSRFLALAEIFEAKLVRSMVTGPDSAPTLPQALAWLTEALPAYESQGVTLALETYEQVSTKDLVELVAATGSPNIGVCLDPANVVARLERPTEVVELAAPVTVNVHAKDFAFARQDGWVGFTYSGAAMGTGLHDYPHLLREVRPRERGVNEIVEHWLPWQGGAEATVRAEQAWTRTTVDYLRSIR
ncbi:sugar phosphate isomerase/epimerase family protein [Glycomyces artemisiae]|uniref:Sugar phosphate isomerase/epimerase n=1 Tax=Glycomyces artemisiae TaxID=1076443 RepID=A0A2T0UX80_9ACTN|nr:TIM barrel protein [Glycomyces artemisiae]PRY62494.1 sugar phosphate isomerase/epimerase [Glycomyces artemisiae]